LVTKSLLYVSHIMTRRKIIAAIERIVKAAPK
jgi:hypothetical protein